MKKKMLFVLLFSVFLPSQPAFSSAMAEKDGVSPEQSLQLLLDGNNHFAQSGTVEHLDKMASTERRKEVATTQKPAAVIIACSDSRVPPELLFDKGLGEIFVVRVAGNIVGPHELGSVEYAVEHLGAKLVMVLGHERCGAVTATYDAHVAGSKVEGNIGSLVTSIKPAVKRVLVHGAKGTKAEIVDQCIRENVRNVAGQLKSHSRIIREELEKGSIKLVKAYYDLDDGKVSLLK